MWLCWCGGSGLCCENGCGSWQCSNREEGVVSSGGSVSVAGGGARWRDSCRFSNRIFGEF